MIPRYFQFNESDEITLFRRIKQGGDTFVTYYLQQLSERESDTNFSNRKAMTPAASFAKKEVMEVNNAIYQRLTDIVRIGGSDSYKRVVAGKDGGVDLDHSSLTHFIGQDVLSELLFMGKVGIFVDMPTFGEGLSVADTNDYHPYCYVYTREQILNWTKTTVNNRRVLTAIELCEKIAILNENGLPTGEEDQYKIYNRLENSVRVRVFNNKKELVSDSNLNIPEIPFILLELPNSLLHETGKYQVALMNMESLNVDYDLKSNFPFYIEHAGAGAGPHLNKDDEIEVGNVQGRKYTGDKQPDFINPSSEPLKASMEKQEQIKNSIRQQINLAVSSITPKSAESRAMDDRGLESGLSAIGEILEHAERKLAVYYAAYEGNDEVATINYPDKYSLKTDEERIAEVKLLQEQKDELPSLTGKKALCKMAAHTLFDTKLPIEEVDKVIKEIEGSNNTGASAKNIVNDVEAGILGHETAAIMRGYDKDEPIKAAQEHADRLARIEEAQTRARLNTQNDSEINIDNAAARGVNDKAPDNQSAKEEKQQSQDPNLNGDGKKKVRGEQK